MKMLVLALAVVAATAARAEVSDRSAAGFEIRHSVVIAAPPAKVYAALLTPGRWWSSAHSWSGDAANLTLDLAKGCFCETLPKGGFVRHMAVVYADGASQLRLEGALGPLVLTGAGGHLGVVLKPSGDQTSLALTYDVGGYAKGGLAETWAGPVDGALGEQVSRLKRYVETGKPE